MEGSTAKTIMAIEKRIALCPLHEAPLNGYQPGLNKERSAYPGQPTKKS